MDNKVPQFCTVDGQRLRLRESSRITGYDAYTGEPQTDNSKQLVCPNGKTLLGSNRHATWTFDGSSWVSN